MHSMTSMFATDMFFFFFSSRRRHTRFDCDWSSDVCSSDLVTACCGMEYMATACSHYDVDRFGAGLPRFSPRQADVLFVVGTISHKIAPVLKRIYDQMAEPKWVVSFGVCTCTGGFYDNYATVMGIDTLMPVDAYIPGCPLRPDDVL